MLMCNLRFLYEDRVLVQLTPKLTMGQDNVSKLKKKIRNATEITE